MRSSTFPLPWLTPGEPFPPVESAWGPCSEAPGLLAAGGDLTTDSLTRAYRAGVFPWFSKGQPILWWSPDPRMVLQVDRFRLHRSLRKTVQRFRNTAGHEVRFDTAFSDVIAQCARTPRHGQQGTWILADMVDAYTALHRQGLAHSVETWANGRLVGGLYCVAIGKAVFGESMFSHVTDASKIALTALIGFCRAHGIAQIDCQQNTRHLASMGAQEMPRVLFQSHMAQAQQLAAPRWQFSPLYWDHVSAAHPLERD